MHGRGSLIGTGFGLGLNVRPHYISGANIAPYGNPYKSPFLECKKGAAALELLHRVQYDHKSVVHTVSPQRRSDPEHSHTAHRPFISFPPPIVACSYQFLFPPPTLLLGAPYLDNQALR